MFQERQPLNLKTFLLTDLFQLKKYSFLKKKKKLFSMWPKDSYSLPATEIWVQGPVGMKNIEKVLCFKKGNL